MSVMIVDPKIYFDCIRALIKVSVDENYCELHGFLFARNWHGFDKFSFNENNRCYSGIERFLSALYTENCRSYKRRYSHIDDYQPMSFRLKDFSANESLHPKSFEVNLWQLVKHLHCIDYQIEHDCRARNILMELVKIIERHLIHHSPEYQDAEWGRAKT